MVYVVRTEELRGAIGARKHAVDGLLWAVHARASSQHAWLACGGLLLPQALQAYNAGQDIARQHRQLHAVIHMHHFLVVGVQLQQEAGVEGAVGRGGQWAMGLGNDSRAQPSTAAAAAAALLEL
eukprot:CAMPEP_0202366860 /NCGR_PEP_ID=MMETSP1126-20121109/17304_1 /ASSEMBLY_ACC=CAM_ASM_000457 /TAXON_ID=3047 /ORGANISM="Dunaliella tertiolecta, Strain CCMP1320" /LENGTH=123 /DNA_ID=CAMNT_0048961997 /DNA_START=1256 /DNA_END=1628 /DNA_ORIENTATION=+